jgi:NAD(P)-dependent dehydrogenase (short-subunit alcohol dehydrogenase family)
VLVDRHDERLAELQAELGGAVSATRVVDLVDPDAVAGLAGTAGDVDALWHLVGGWRGGRPIDETPLSDWSDLYPPVVTSTVLLARTFAPLLAPRPTGRFVIVSSPQAQRPTSTNAGYAAAKAAAEATVLALADHFARAGSGATANIVVVPALLTAAMREASPDRTWRTFVDVADLADTLVHLTTDAASRMNGQRINLFDGSPS